MGPNRQKPGVLISAPVAAADVDARPNLPARLRLVLGDISSFALLVACSASDDVDDHDDSQAAGGGSLTSSDP